MNDGGNKALLSVLHKTGNPQHSGWVSLFALQVPIMLLSYALIMYVLGLSFMVVRPLWNDHWEKNSLVCILNLCNALIRDEILIMW
jgi:hypothetical protein